MTAVGRRALNKQQKLDRIVEAAGELFDAHGMHGVTTQAVAERAGVGAGTVFLYAKTKGELLLLVQNARYAEALGRGRKTASRASGDLDRVMALVTPVVECNRMHVENGRHYLREMVFGAPGEPQREAALAIVAETEEAVAGVLAGAVTGAGAAPARDAARAAALARVVSAVLYLAMASAPAAAPAADVLAAVRDQLRAAGLR
ncbi:TetR/AcrR family transcriptional regulator [Herbiconiux moechotypicola]|uniref:HTH tetR-type domain-containing protein n=1 Tax=Herbiconiux moechotypicola TaxID=637393 RepID=A0ABN3DET5_9MICO|nr:TetR/AcrR family transcriptional regulator [Herbiconiux moechotypicola]MCS5729262.1 TetR/AcrR family transcriptional regulator [Herbiconiux moechotypicola]